VWYAGYLERAIKVKIASENVLVLIFFVPLHPLSPILRMKYTTSVFH